jgi:hypothetical protein
VIAAAGMILLLLGFTPFTFDTSSPVQIVASVLGALVVFSTVAVCFLKHRLMHGWIGFFFLPLAIYGASRLGKPGSPWARRRYGERNSVKQVRAEERFPPDRRTDRFKNAFRDIVGGKPSKGVAAVQQEAAAATREAVQEARERAERIRH